MGSLSLRAIWNDIIKYFLKIPQICFNNILLVFVNCFIFPGLLKKSLYKLQVYIVTSAGFQGSKEKVKNSFKNIEVIIQLQQLKWL